MLLGYRRPQFVDTLFIVRSRPNMSMRHAVIIIIVIIYYLYLQFVQRSKKLIKTNYPVNAIYGFHVKNCIKCWIWGQGNLIWIYWISTKIYITNIVILYNKYHKYHKKKNRKIIVKYTLSTHQASTMNISQIFKFLFEFI